MQPIELHIRIHPIYIPIIFFTLLMAIAVLIAIPIYRDYLSKQERAAVIEMARTEAEAAKIKGACGDLH